MGRCVLYVLVVFCFHSIKYFLMVWKHTHKILTKNKKTHNKVTKSATGGHCNRQHQVTKWQRASESQRSECWRRKSETRSDLQLSWGAATAADLSVSFQRRAGEARREKRRASTLRRKHRFTRGQVWQKKGETSTRWGTKVARAPQARPEDLESSSHVPAQLTLSWTFHVFGWRSQDCSCHKVKVQSSQTAH